MFFVKLKMLAIKLPASLSLESPAKLNFSGAFVLTEIYNMS